MPAFKLSGETRKMDLHKVYIFRGLRYGPGEKVEVPVEFGTGIPRLMGQGMGEPILKPASPDDEPQDDFVQETGQSDAAMPLPEDFPHLAQLLANRIETVGQLRMIGEYADLNGIGETRWKDIQKALDLI